MGGTVGRPVEQVITRAVTGPALETVISTTAIDHIVRPQVRQPVWDAVDLDRVRDAVAAAVDPSERPTP